MKREKLFYIVAMVLLAAALVAALWYKRPLDIRQITGVAEPETISISVIMRDENMDLQERILDLSAGDEGFDELLARLEEIQFRRPPTNLIRIAIPLHGLPNFYRGETKEAEAGTFQRLILYLSATEESGETVIGQVTFEVDQWWYHNFDRNVDLDLAVTDSEETGQALCAELWEQAQPVESRS